MRHLLFLLLSLAGVAQAKDTTLVVPGQGWQLRFDGPAFIKRGENDRPGQYVYEGSAGKFNLSLYVEDPGCRGGNTHKAFYACFWPNARRNPMIVPSSVVATEAPAYYKVTYDIQASYEGRIITQRNVNYLIAYRGKWTDLHVSVVEPTAEDIAALEALEKSLVYTTTTPAPR